MAVEVEIKAWVRDPARVRAALDSFCVFRHEYRKRDEYFRGAVVDERSQDVRIRAQDGKWVCTFKRKTLRGSLEVNGEREFEVSDGAALAELLVLLGARPFVRKNKAGRSYSYGDLTVELSEVEGLGTFIEVERLLHGTSLDGLRDEEVAEVEASIRAFLARIGVSESDVEARPYTEMLLGLGRNSR